MHNRLNIVDAEDNDAMPTPTTMLENDSYLTPAAVMIKREKYHKFVI